MSTILLSKQSYFHSTSIRISKEELNVNNQMVNMVSFLLYSILYGPNPWKIKYRHIYLILYGTNSCKIKYRQTACHVYSNLNGQIPCNIEYAIIQFFPYSILHSIISWKIDYTWPATSCIFDFIWQEHHITSNMRKTR